MSFNSNDDPVEVFLYSSRLRLVNYEHSFSLQNISEKHNNIASQVFGLHFDLFISKGNANIN